MYYNYDRTNVKVLLVSVWIPTFLFRYGFDFGSIHFVMMSTEHNFTAGSKQYNFLANHLKSINRTRTPWFIFTGHRYSRTCV